MGSQPLPTTLNDVLRERDWYDRLLSNHDDELRRLMFQISQALDKHEEMTSKHSYCSDRAILMLKGLVAKLGIVLDAGQEKTYELLLDLLLKQREVMDATRGEVRDIFNRASLNESDFRVFFAEALTDVQELRTKGERTLMHACIDTNVT